MDKIFDLILLLAGAAIFVFVLSGASERVTEMFKKLLLTITKGKFPHGDSSWLLAVIPAFAAVYGLNLDFFTQFEMFKTLDPELVRLLNGVFLWVASNWQHDRKVFSSPAKK